MEQITNFIQSPTGSRIIIVFCVFLFIWIITTILKRLIPKYVEDTASKYRTRKILNFFGFLLMASSIMIVYGGHLQGLSIFLGVAGAGVAFALQEMISSVAGYTVIYFSKFYKVGDRVLLGGIKGDVVDIGILRTSLMELGGWVNGDLYNGRVVRVANSFVFKEPVFNYSGEFPFLWDEITVPIKHISDYKFAQEKFMEILEEVQGEFVEKMESHWNKMKNSYMIEDAKTEPMVSVVFDENWITFTLRYVVDFKQRRSTKDKLSQKLLAAIQSSNGQIEIAGSTLELSGIIQNN